MRHAAVFFRFDDAGHIQSMEIIADTEAVKAAIKTKFQQFQLKKRRTYQGSHHRPLEEYEAALRKSGGFITRAARILGISRPAVAKRIRTTPRLQEILQEEVDKRIAAQGDGTPVPKVPGKRKKH